MQKFFISLQISAALQLLGSAFGAPAQGGPAAGAGEVKKFADQLVAASTAADQDKLAENAEPAFRSAVLTDLVSRAYQFSVRGEFAQAESLCNLTERLAKIDSNNEVALAGAKVVH